ncbi:MAG TPA: serine/threonine-protein kinase, partial [Phycisphaerae bacterium]|nr:serine/threonine-protein kinase [Phycisphaerae bacterium]
MRNSDSSFGAGFDSAVELDRFGFNDAAGPWLDRFRAAVVPAPLGCIGPYEVLEEVARGGQGIVYLARQPGTQRIVAVKRLLTGPWAGAAARGRFEHEVRVVSSFRHPNIVTLFAMDVIEGLPIFAMEWVEGVPITQWASPERSMRDIVCVFIRVCEAVHYAHQRGVIHRDLKPSNILIDENGEPRVLDFGIAMPIAGSVESAGLDDSYNDRFVGTVAYAAPEQFHDAGRDVDVRTDLY